MKPEIDTTLEFDDAELAALCDHMINRVVADTLVQQKMFNELFEHLQLSRFYNVFAVNMKPGTLRPYETSARHATFLLNLLARTVMDGRNIRFVGVGSPAFERMVLKFAPEKAHILGNSATTRPAEEGGPPGL